MATQAEIWVALKVQPYSVMPTTSVRVQEWFAQMHVAVQPKTWWKPMIQTHQGHHVRITRCDFPDHSSVVATETWHKNESECAGGQEYAYFLHWKAFPIQ